MNKKLAAAKAKLKKHSSDIIFYSSAVATAVLSVYTLKQVSSARSAVAKANKDIAEVTRFLGNGPDFIAFDEELANKIDGGEVYEYTLVNGVRIAIMKALKD